MQRSKRAFTLIELLVVIAIIAILAAILFPVFAQAREKARQASCMSNTKQLSLGILMYTQDFDELFPFGQGMTSWTGGDEWPVRVQPYIKNLGVFTCPSDPKKGPFQGASAWEGWGISYAVNGYYDPNWCCAPNWNTGFRLLGPMGFANQSSWLAGDSNSQAAMGRPADTILITEKYNGDTTYWGGNASGFSTNNVIGGPDVEDIGWGDQLQPDGTRSPTVAYPKGQNGSVSAHHANMTNFAFCDGHVKAMRPISTDPDPKNQPQNNLWDGTRP